MISSHEKEVESCFFLYVQHENELDHAATMEAESCPDCGFPLNACDNHWAPGVTGIARRAWLGCPNVTAQEIEEDQ